MKKSQLRNIIKESIKGLIIEQNGPVGGPTGNGRAVAIVNCTYNGSMYFTPGNSFNLTIDGIAPVVGDVFYHWNSAGGNHPAHGNLMKVVSVNPPDTSQYETNYPSALCDGNGWDYGCVDPSATNFDPNVSSIPTLLNAYAHVRADCSGQDAWAAQNIHGNPGFLQHVDLSCCTYLSVDPCDDFNAAPINLQQGCCGKCNVNGVYTGSPTDQCGILGNPNFCDCCPEPVGDERGCLDSTATNYLECCPQNNYPGCVANIPTNENCCKYEPNDYGWVCDVDPFVPLKEQWGPIPINSFACQPGTASNPGSYPTQILCQAANTNIPKGCGMSSQIQCSKCNNGYPISNMFSGPNCPPGWQLASLGDPCKPLPNPNDPLDMVDPQIQRMKTLSGIKKPK